jgi:peptidoglycan-associated lipoprotein
MAIRMISSKGLVIASVIASVMVSACGGKKPPVAHPVQPPDSPATGTPLSVGPAAGSSRVVDTPLAAPPPAPAIADDPMATRTVDDLNRDSPFRPVFYDYDSADLSPDARAVLDANAETLKRYAGWVITIEGHCDERGTAEYNLALGERRAVAAQAYLVSLGIPSSRIRTVSYGKEFPFDPGHDDAAWARNRRAHIIITGK